MEGLVSRTGGAAAVPTALGSSLARLADVETLCGFRSRYGVGAAVATALGSSSAGLTEGEMLVLAVSKVEAVGLPPVAC